MSFTPNGAAASERTPIYWQFDFPFRAERLFDSPNDIMADDKPHLALSGDLIDVVIAEVKTNQPCTLNGPWTRQDRRNVHRVLAAIGCLQPDLIDAAAADIYRVGFHRSGFRHRIRLIAVGRDRSDDLGAAYPEVTQLIWAGYAGSSFGIGFAAIGSRKRR